jgi:asparagine synthase (glutamine-hydrolysing)
MPISVVKRFERFMFQKDDELTKIVNARYFNLISTLDFFKSQFPSSNGNGTQELMNMDRQSWLVDEALLRGDKMAMANAVEARVPLLSTALINLANSLPINWKVSPFNTKIILKEAFRDMLPENVLTAPKRGFFSPGAKWLRQADFLAHAKEVLDLNYYPETNELFNWDNVKDILEKHLSGEYHYNPIWAILTFQIWAKRFGITL